MLQSSVLLPGPHPPETPCMGYTVPRSRRSSPLQVRCHPGQPPQSRGWHLRPPTCRASFFYKPMIFTSMPSCCPPICTLPRAHHHPGPFPLEVSEHSLQPQKPQPLSPTVTALSSGILFLLKSHNPPPGFISFSALRQPIISLHPESSGSLPPL